jgi:DNA polymerase III gamma/tau subunit
VTLEQVIGQDKVTSILKKKLVDKSLPNVILFAGPPGSGKTTTARIVANSLGCLDHNLVEINCGHVRGIDSVREIADAVPLAPMGGKCKIWILDEIVQLPKATQQAFLKILEDVPSHVYFLLCASDTSGLLPTFSSRCFALQFESLAAKHINAILQNIAIAENAKITSNLLFAIQSQAQGNARKAIQLLEAVLSCDGEEQQLEAVKTSAIELEEKHEFLARLIFKKCSWKEMFDGIKPLEEKDIEGLRRQVLAYAAAMMGVPGSQQLAFQVIREFETPFYNNGGKAGLMAAAYSCCQGKK